jgi:linalool dehydratase/isomerase-like protein
MYHGQIRTVTRERQVSPVRRIVIAFVSVVIAGAIYLPCLHWAFRPSVDELVSTDGVAPLPAKLARRHLHLWTDPEKLEGELARMRRANAEWDFMGRSFLAWSLANISLRDSSQAPRMLEAMDRIIDQTLLLEQENGSHFFLMDYAFAKPWKQHPPRSLFVDGEIALMLGMRCLVEDKPTYRAELNRLIHVMVERMEASPSLSAESYPDECWTFCNVTALSAIRLSDFLNGTDHAPLIRRWLAYAKANLIDPTTGLLISAFRLNGETIYPPEGSSIWYVSHHLALLDEPFGRQQYELAKSQLAGRVLGFAYAREWPPGIQGQMDVDSGLAVPGLGASVVSSGLAFIAAGTYGDVEFLQSLMTGVSAMGFGVETDGALRYAASNQVGDAVMLYGLTTGPIWERVARGTE